MNLSKATLLITETAQKMDDMCKETVFDEFGIIAVDKGNHFLCWYHGVRRQNYIKMFKSETALLKRESRSRLINRYEIGDYEFVHDGTGSQAETFLVIGEHIYLLCTNTRKSMDEVSANPLWLGAQTAFVELSEKFVLDPVQVQNIHEMEKIDV